MSGGNGDITVASNIAWSTGANLTLSAYRNIGVNTGVTISNSGAGNLVLRADNSSNGVGAITFAGTGKINYSGSTGTASLFYDPVGTTKYQHPVNYSPSYTANGAVPNQITPYMLVNNITDLQNINTYLSGNYALGTNVDASSLANLTPLGDDTTPFSGIFDGQFKTIDHLTITASTGFYVGLFGYNTGVIRNVALTNEQVTTSGTVNNAGGLAGANYGTILNASTKGTLSNNVDGSFAGGLAAYNDSSATIATSTSSMSVSESTNGDVGGLVGFNLNTITDSYATGAVSGLAGSAVGGLAGYNFSQITRSYSTGSVTGGSFKGGFVGYNDGSFVNSYWNTVTSGSSVATAVGSSTGATGRTTTQLQNGTLPSGFLSNTWTAASGHYPSLNWEAPAGVTISGTVYNGATPVGAITVIGLVNGANVGSATTNGSGAYSFQLLSGTSTSGGVLAYLSGGSYLGNTFTFGSAGSFAGTDIYANTLRLINNTNTTYSSMITALNAAMGAASQSNFLYSISGGVLSLNSGKNLYILNPASSFNLDQSIATAGTLSISNTGALTQSSALSVGALALLGTGGVETLTNAGNSIGTLAASSGSVSVRNGSAPIIIGTVGSTSGITATGTVTVNTAGALTLANSVSAQGSGSALILADGGTFTNAAGSSALSVAAGARWLVYSQNPATDTRGGLAYGFKQYNATYGATTPAQATGNGFLYTLAPTITAGLTGSVSRQYNGATTATLTAANYSALSGALDGDTLALASQPTSGLFATKNVGTGKTVSVSGLSLSASNGASTVYGYQMNSGLSANIGSISAAPLTAAVTVNNKVYDSGTAATGSVGALSGVFGADSVSLTGIAGYSFANKNVGSGKTVTESGLSLTGTDAGNYTLGALTGSASITAASLTAAVLANNRSYNGTTMATGSLGALTGILGSDSVSVLNPGAFSFANKNVGNGKTVTASGATLTGADAGNYTLGALTGSANITRSTLTSVVTANNKVYDTSVSATGSLGALSGIFGSDSVSLSGAASLAFADKNAANGKIVTASGLSLAGADASNYMLGALTGTANITPAPLTASLSANNKVYDGTSAATGSLGSLSGVLGSDTVSLSGLASFSFANKNVGNGKSVTASGGSLTGADSGNYSLSGVTGTANITPATLTAAVMANNKVYDTTVAATGSLGTLSGVFGNDSVSLAGAGAFAFSTKNVGTGKTVTVSGVSLTGSDAGNYTLPTLTGIANITAAPLSVLFMANNKVYDSTTAATGSLGALSGVLGSDNVTLSGTTNLTFSDKNVGNGKIVTAAGLSLTGTDAGNYMLGALTGTANITPASLTASLSANNKVYDGTTAASGSLGSLSGVLGSDTVSLSGLGSFSFADKNVGNGKTVTAAGGNLTGPDAGNYSLAAVTTTADITPATLTATVTANNKVYDTTVAATGSLGALSGVFGGDSVTLGGTSAFAFSTKNVGTGKPVTVSGLSLIGSDAGNYTLVPLTGSADVTAAPLSVALTANNKIYDSTTAATGSLGPLSGVIGSDSVSLTGTANLAFTDKNVGNGKTVVAAGLSLSGVDAGNYSLGGPTTAANITPASITASVSAENKVYDATTVASGSLGRLMGVLGNDNVSVAGIESLSFANKNVGNGKTVTASGGYLTGPDAGNYSLTNVTGAADITPAVLTAPLTAINKVYDGGTAATGSLGSLSGVLASDNVGLSGTSTYAFADKNAGNGKVVTASGIRLAGSDSSNYVLSPITGMADITPALLTYISSPANRTAGFTDTAFTGTVTGLVNGETLISATTGQPVFTTSATAASSAGLYPINGSGLAANNGNYVFAQAAGNASALTVLASTVPAVQLGTAGVSVNQSNIVVIDNSPKTLPTQILFQPAISTLVSSEVAAALSSFQTSFSTSADWSATGLNSGNQTRPLAQSSFFSLDNNENSNTRYPGSAQPQ